MDSTKKFLEVMASQARNSYKRIEGMAYASMYDFILQEGAPYTKVTFLEERMEAKACFRNALLMAQEYGYQYVEGFASNIMPVHHAWCVDSEGTVVETTWGTGNDYFGVVFPISYMLKLSAETELWCSAIDNYTMEWPLLTGKHVYSTLEE